MILLFSFCLFLSVAEFLVIFLFLKITHSIWKNLTYSLISAFTWTTLAGFFLSWFSGKINLISLIGPAIILLPISLILIFYHKTYFWRQIKRNFAKKDLFSKRIFFLFLLFFIICSVLLFSNSLIVKKNTIIAGNRLVWVDWPIHISIINSFAFGNNFPPENPLFAGQFLRYPFMSDFLSALFVKSGFPINWATALPAIFLFTSFIFIYFSFARQLTQNLKAAFLSLLLIIFSGGAGFIYYLKDLITSPNLLPLIQFPPKEYTYWDEKNIWFINLIWGEIIPQRAFLFGLPIFFLILTFLLNGLSSRKKIYFVLAGIFTGLLPFFHSYTLLSLMIFLFLFIPLSFLIFKDQKPKKLLSNWAFFLIPSIFLGLLQLPLFLGFAQKQIKFHLFWMAEGENFLLFWLKNTSIFLPLFLLALVSNSIKTKLKIFSLASFFIFLVVNFISFSPWAYDNMKLLTFWYLTSVPLIAVFLQNLLANKKIYFSLLALLLFIILTLSGFLEVYRLMNFKKNQLILWDKKDLNLAEFVKNNTSKKSIFLTSSVHNHPVTGLAGRKIMMGYPGTLWTWGIDYQKREQDIKKILSGGNKSFSLINKYQISYLISDPLLEKNQFVNKRFWEDNFPLVFENKNYKIFKLQ